ncbi:MAG: response regulator [Planctomycetales bacterium]|nr:response regulator [Planctomycetales bacterium]NIM09131.1 response regulator [Planctomycetales bacterium]NIN08598.1 response regulator [Planctomycetales bacterium]NIN77724.1 response regulator [Planctomycetales bacterium]NIO34896.1 response regulator [Planctomycetales bacterium]
MIMSANRTVYVVDPEPEGYQTLMQGVKGQQTRFEFVSSGRDALRRNAKARPDLWIINVRLPDMSGMDLQQMLHARNPDVPCYLVGDQYQPEDEVKARQCGATMYFCKPLRREWVVSANTDADP